ncbi:RimK family alpha-L-glutamate ligase [Candidatus Woesearchaeota archaeon]|nr:MAG: RimK family alpha-L-glutamate ligase [Candidatus Woesearchaeota archaeon]
MKAALISLGSISSKWLIEALGKQFDSVDHIDVAELEVSLGGKEGRVLYQGNPLPKYDCIYARGSFRYAVLLRAVTTLLQENTYMPLRAASFTIGHDKLLTHLKFQENGVPQPTTYLAATAAAGKKILQKVKFPVVFKLPAGTHGKGVMIADSQESASSMVDALALLKQPFLIQEFVETGGTDYRCIVVGDEVVAAMKRVAGKGESRANIHAGGQGIPIDVDARTRQAALLAAKSCGLEVCAVDILPSAKGPLVLEVNLSPGLQGITKVTGLNIAEKIAKFLRAKTEERQNVRKKAVLQEVEPEQEVHGELDFRGDRILLPEVVTMASKIKQGDEVVIRAKKGQVYIVKQKGKEKSKE